MHSLPLLLIVAALLAVPGIGASCAVFRPGSVALVTRMAAAFGFGYAVAAGIAFVLAATHSFELAAYLPIWLALSAGLWLLAWRAAPLREQLRGIGTDVRRDWPALLIGAGLVLAVVIANLHFVHVLGASRYIYYLDGEQIANSHGVPAATLNYGQSWPPATDKVVLDAFTGVVVLLGHNVAAGPGVLLFTATVGTALGLWAVAWEVGLRFTGGLLPLFVLANSTVLDTAVTRDFQEYRAEDFGRAIAFIALAVGLHAFRRRSWLAAVAAGLVVAVASGTHLIPLAVVVLVLVVALGAELLRPQPRAAGGGTGATAAAGEAEPERPPRRRILLQGLVTFGVAGAAAVLIRLFAGGTFGLGGATNPASYDAVNTAFDPTAFLFAGGFFPKHGPAGTHWYTAPGTVISAMMAASGLHWSLGWFGLLLAGVVAGAVLLFLFAPGELAVSGIVGLGFSGVVVLVALAFDYHFHVWIDATFGVRKLRDFVALGLIIAGLGVLEAALRFIAARWHTVAGGLVSAALAVSAAAWLLPGAAAATSADRLSTARVQFVDWVRQHTACDARFLVNQRTEGTFTALTGRYATLEGMGSFLRSDTLDSVVHLVLDARRFFHDPRAHLAFLSDHDVSYVVVGRGDLVLGYQAPIGEVKLSRLDATPGLRRVFSNADIVVYRVSDPHEAPESPLLEGPEVHCLTTPVRF